jgi:hypothetical protein
MVESEVEQFCVRMEGLAEEIVAVVLCDDPYRHPQTAH